MTQDVIVVGAGVIGLSVAVVLAERGHDVEILTRDDPLQTTSVTASAMVGPSFAPAGPRTLRGPQVMITWAGGARPGGAADGTVGAWPGTSTTASPCCAQNARSLDAASPMPSASSSVGSQP